jgi:hypothetical protein
MLGPTSGLYTACRWGSEQVDLIVWILKLTLLYLINYPTVTVTVTVVSQYIAILSVFGDENTVSGVFGHDTRTLSFSGHHGIAILSLEMTILSLDMRTISLDFMPGHRHTVFGGDNTVFGH